MDYLTIDFETANERLTSACSIGIIGVNNGKTELEEYYLINPNEEFNPYNISIHHLTPEDVKDADGFDKVWEKIASYFLNTPVFAHNAAFDLSVLKANIEKYHLQVPAIRFGCTCKIAEKLWKGEVANFRLNTIAQYLEAEHDQHNALSDAKICAEIIRRGMKVMGSDTASALYDDLGLRFGYYDDKRYYPSYRKFEKDRRIHVIENAELNEKVVFVSGKPSTMNRNELIRRILENGAFVERNINRSLDYFLELGSCPQQKLNIVSNLISQGTPIKILSENDILRLLK